MAVVAVICTDLIFSTKILSTAASLGVQARPVRSLQMLSEVLHSGDVQTVLIDLDADGVDAVEAIQRCGSEAAAAAAMSNRSANADGARPTPPRIIAFVSHIRADLAAAARRAGADEVLARSAFVSRLPGILAGAGRSHTAPGIRPSSEAAGESPPARR
jgi:CheY-like chemotaxis protein